MTTDKAFCKSTDGSFGSDIACGDSKCVSRVNVYSSKNHTLSFSWWEWSNVINRLQGRWLITLGNGASLETQCSSSQLTDGHSAGAVTMMALISGIPCYWALHILHPSHHDHFVHEPHWMMTGWLGEKTDSIHLIIKILLCWGCPWIFTQDPNILTFFFSFREICPPTSSPNFLLINFLIMFLTIFSANHWP